VKKFGLVLLILGLVAIFRIPALATHDTQCGSAEPIHLSSPNWNGNSSAECPEDVSDVNNNWTGGGGADVIFSRGGGDDVDGQAGGDKIYGGDGNDILRGGDGVDIIYADQGCSAVADWVYGNEKSDEFWAGCGADYINGGPGSSDTLNHYHDGCTDTIENIEIHYHIDVSNNC
jgi:Ca2+-binding RTX toxin-like protein